MKTKIGEILLLLGVILFVVGGIGLLGGYLPRDIIPAMTVLALIFVGVGASIKRRIRK